jgi:hypothetical protein
MDNKMKLYSLLWGQSSKTTQSKVETHLNYEQCKNDYDSLGLLKILREFVFKSDDRQYKYKAEDQAKRAYYNLRQTPEMSCQEYFECVRNIVEVIKSLGGSLADDMHLADELPDTRPARGYTEAQNREARERILNKKVAYGLLVRADRGRYGKLIEEVENAYLKGNNDYPKTPTEAYNLLVNYKSYNTNKRTQPGGLDQVAFVAEGKRLKGDGEYPNIQCFKCKRMGHYKSDCPEKGKTEQTQVVPATTLMTRARVMTMMKEDKINPMWILCDNESTIDVIKNPDLIVNVRRAKRHIELTGIGKEPIKIQLEGELPGYGTVYFHPEVAANILSFHKLTKRFKSVTYDNKVKDAFLVQRDDGSFMEFKPSEEGLYYYDFTQSIKRKKEQEEEDKKEQAMIIKTVEGIQRNFTKREIKAAEEARRMYVIVGRPSQKIFESLLTGGKLVNSTITVQDYRNALQMFGEDIGVLKGKTTRTKPEHVQVQVQEKPQPRNVILSIDVMFFTGLSFLITVSRNIRFITATLLQDRKKATIFKAIQQVFRVYQGRGHIINDVEFTQDEIPIHTILADNEFQALKEEIEEVGVTVNVVAKDEHVPEVERQNRVIKERARAVIQTLPYKKIPRKIRVALIHYVVFWLNNLPKEGQVQSPKEMIMGAQVLDTKMLCKLPFGAYAQVHDDVQATNTMEPRTTGAINLGPSNLQGGHKFLSLATGDIITRRKWTELPVPSEVILRLEELASDTTDTLEEMLQEDRESENNLEAEQNPGIVTEERVTDNIEEEEQNISEEVEVVREQQEELTLEEQEDPQNLPVEDAVNVSASDETTVTSNATNRGRYNLRPNRTPNYLRRFAFLSVQAGIKRWGDRAREAVREEL